jgi:hypothetical protein
LTDGARGINRHARPLDARSIAMALKHACHDEVIDPYAGMMNKASG